MTKKDTHPAIDEANALRITTAKEACTKALASLQNNKDYLLAEYKRKFAQVKKEEQVILDALDSGDVYTIEQAVPALRNGISNRYDQ